jgi:hypothetical protein
MVKRIAKMNPAILEPDWRREKHTLNLTLRE